MISGLRITEIGSEQRQQSFHSNMPGGLTEIVQPEFVVGIGINNRTRKKHSNIILFLYPGSFMLGCMERMSKILGHRNDANFAFWKRLRF